MKKLTLAILAVMTVGASAQTRTYVTEGGMTTMPSNTEMRVMEVTPVRVMPVTTSTSVLVVPSSSSDESTMRTRHYMMDDTADTSDDLNRSDYYQYIYQTESGNRLLDRDGLMLDGSDGMMNSESRVINSETRVMEKSEPMLDSNGQMLDKE